MFAAQKPLHPHTEVTQLDAVARLMDFKCQSNLSRDKFDALLVVIGSILPKGHILTKSFYESTKILSSLKMTYEKIELVQRDACYLEKNMPKENIASIANPLGTSRLTLVMARRGRQGLPKRSFGIFHSCQGSNGFS
jgi:hypothetical protein